MGIRPASVEEESVDEYPKIVVPPPGPNARDVIARDARTVSQNLT